MASVLSEDPRYVLLGALADALANYRDIHLVLDELTEEDLDELRDDLLAAINGLATLSRQVAGELERRPDLLEPYLLLNDLLLSTLLIAQAQSTTFLTSLPLLSMAKAEKRAAAISY